MVESQESKTNIIILGTLFSTMNISTVFYQISHLEHYKFKPKCSFNSSPNNILCPWGLAVFNVYFIKHLQRLVWGRKYWVLHCLHQLPALKLSLKTESSSVRLLLTFFPCAWPQNLLNIIASVLHLGNTQFGEGEEGETYITTETRLNSLAKVRTVPLVLLDVQICRKTHRKA